MITIHELRLPLINHGSARNPQYPHQIAMAEAWDIHPTTLLTAKTGTGKTRSAILPVLTRGDSAVAVYPTNELLRDQVRSVASFARSEGFETEILSPEEVNAADWPSRYSRADVILIPLDRLLLDQWQAVRRSKNRGETLWRLLNPDKAKIVFTNPDILFLILGLRYHAEGFEALRGYQTLIIDEFHLYQGVELAHALVMVALARGFGIFRRLILLSATPHPEVQQLLERAFDPKVIQMETALDPAPAMWRTAVHQVELTPLQITSGDPVEVFVSQLVGLRPELERLRLASPDEDYLPAVVIVNSVLNAIRLEDRLVAAGFSRESFAVIRGLTNRAIRDRRGKLIALGTSAIEVGVDFHCDYLLFEALEASSFLQRFGRVGRHGPGKAVALVPPNVFTGMNNTPAELDRAHFEERIHSWYPSLAARPWFVLTEHGMVTSRALAENLFSKVQEDHHALPEVLTQLRTKIDEILADHADRLGCAGQNLQAKLAFDRCSAGKTGAKWLTPYRRLNSFRTSLPSIEVHDFMEQSRRGDWNLAEYEVDLATLLKRGVDMVWNEKIGKLTINGIGKVRQVHASDMFDDDDCGRILETSDWPRLLLYQDGLATPVADFMGRKNHIFALVPRATVQQSLDWRLPVFESGKYLMAFDGGALLLMEMFRRAKQGLH